jgi:uncharacterized protein HemX
MKKTAQQIEPLPAAEVQKIMAQAIVTGLVALLILGLSFFYYVWKQNRTLQSQMLELTEQAQVAQRVEVQYQGFVNDLSAYSQAHPDVLQVLLQSGIEVPQARPAPGELAPLPLPPTGP